MTNQFCGSADKHPYELYLQFHDIEHTKTKVKSPQTNEICERFNQTVLNEFYKITFRKKLYSDIDTLQKDLTTVKSSFVQDILSAYIALTFEIN